MSTEATEDKNARIYPCRDCGKMRSKAEGGTTFTVCDECWDKHFGPKLTPDLEADNERLRALVQGMVDGLEDLVYLEFRNSEGVKSGAPTAKEWLSAFDKAQHCIDAAKEQGFTPTNTEAPTSEGSTTLAPTNTDGELD